MRSEPNEALMRAFSSPLRFFDVQGLSEDEQRRYAQEAQQLVVSEFLRNEKDRLIHIWAQESILRAKDYDEVRDLRMCINAIQLFWERLEELAASPQPQTLEDPHADL